MERIQTIQFTGQAGIIDCAMDWPDPQQPIQGWALLLHPHPLHEGTRNNKVITTLSRAATQQGLVAVRPDFRGVGKSAGQFDQAQGETLDMVELVTQFNQQFSELAQGHFVVGGFSFGTAVAAQLATLLAQSDLKAPQALVLAGCAVERFRFTSELILPARTYLVHGADDDVVPLQESMDFAQQHDLAVSVIPQAGHFFHGKLILLRELVAQQWQLALLHS